MHKSLLDILVDPASKTPLQVEVDEVGPDGNIITGMCQYSGHREQI
jgi:uncharacterized protein YbaR (Trm112 family)